MKSPVLLIVFNRPDNTRQVFNRIKEAQPPRLYIAADGPRKNRKDDETNCSECRNIVQEIDWPCEVHTLFREKNLGCARGVSEGITWAFENEDRLIILEDDCVPQLTFFSFCDEMLERYKDDTRVWQVCGRSHHSDMDFFNHSDYIFSRFSHIWGWATWKRCWEQYDLYMNDFPQFREMGGLLNTAQAKWIGKRENELFEKVYKEIKSVDVYNTWDYQWGYIKNKNNGLGIVPCQNLILNIGVDGAHTSGRSGDTLPLGDMPTKLRHPLFVIPIRSYDLYHARNVIFPHQNLFVRAAKKLYQILNSCFNKSK